MLQCFPQKIMQYRYYTRVILASFPYNHTLCYANRSLKKRNNIMGKATDCLWE